MDHFHFPFTMISVLQKHDSGGWQQGLSSYYCIKVHVYNISMLLCKVQLQKHSYFFFLFFKAVVSALNLLVIIYSLDFCEKDLWL